MSRSAKKLVGAVKLRVEAIVNSIRANSSKQQKLFAEQNAKLEALGKQVDPSMLPVLEWYAKEYNVNLFMLKAAAGKLPRNLQNDPDEVLSMLDRLIKEEEPL